MKRLPKIIQADKRGQIVIPKEVRQALGITEETGFWVYVIEGEGVLLKQVDSPELADEAIIAELRENAEKLGIEAKEIDKLIKDYKNRKGGLEEV